MRRWLAAALLLLWAAPVYARGDIALSAVAQPDRLPPGHAFRLIITVKGEGIQSLPDPVLPRLKDFEIVGSSVSQQISMVNMKVVMSRATTYQVLAPKEGTFQIPPVTLKVGGKTYATDPVTITVDPNAPPPKGPTTARRRPGSIFPDLGSLFDEDVFGRPRRPIEKDDVLVTMTVDKTEAVPYERIVATFSFSSAVNLWDNPVYTKPKFEGFWMENLPFDGGKTEQKTIERRNGKRYEVTRIRYALFPIAPGGLTVDPAAIVVSAGPWSEHMRLSTDPIPIEVRPFPEEGKPEGFSNMALSGFNLTATADPPRARVNESVTLRIKITGDGYLKAVAAPDKPVIEGFDVYDPKVEDVVDKSGGSIRSTRVIEFPMVPRVEGAIRIEPIALSAYDPERKRYVTRTAGPFEVMVLPRAAGGLAAPQARHAIEPPKTGERYIKPDVKELIDWGAPAHRTWGLWAAFFLPIPFLVTGWALARRRKRLLTDERFARAVGAAKSARARLARAETITDPRAFYAALDQTARGYLADKWNVPAPSVTKEFAAQRLDGKNRGLAEGFRELLEAVETARYSHMPDENMSAHLRMARELIEKMESVVK